MKGITVTSKNIGKFIKNLKKQLDKPREIEIYCTKCNCFHFVDKCYGSSN